MKEASRGGRSTLFHFIRFYCLSVDYCFFGGWWWVGGSLVFTPAKKINKCGCVKRAWRDSALETGGAKQKKKQGNVQTKTQSAHFGVRGSVGLLTGSGNMAGCTFAFSGVDVQNVLGESPSPTFFCLQRHASTFYLFIYLQPDMF